MAVPLRKGSLVNSENTPQRSKPRKGSPDIRGRFIPAALCGYEESGTGVGGGLGVR